MALAIDKRFNRNYELEHENLDSPPSQCLMLNFKLCLSQKTNASGTTRHAQYWQCAPRNFQLKEIFKGTFGCLFHAQLRNLVKRLRSKRSDMFPGSTPGLGTKCINTFMKVFEIIKEAVSSVLFHVIDFAGAESMLKQDKFRQKDISFTRSLTGEYHIGNKIIGVVFQFDGDLLNRKYKGGPVGTEDWDLDDKLTMRGKENKQLEDRLHTKDGIAGVSKYIKNAILFCPKEFVSASSRDDFDEAYLDSIKYIASVEKLLTTKGIPFRYVSTVKELFNKNVNNKQGFLEAVAIVDEDEARKLGLKIVKQYNVVLVLMVNHGTPEDPEWAVQDEEQISINADSYESAQTKGAEIARQKTDNIDGYDEGIAEWFVEEIDEVD